MSFRQTVGYGYQWTPEEIQALDPDLAPMIEWLENNTLPEHFPQEKSHGLQSLWAQRADSKFLL